MQEKTSLKTNPSFSAPNLKSSPHSIKSNKKQTLKYNAVPGSQKQNHNARQIFQNLEFPVTSESRFIPFITTSPFPQLSSTQTTTSKMHSDSKNKKKKKKKTKSKLNSLTLRRNNPKHSITMHINQELKIR